MKDILTNLENSTSVEPRGWFRWLHNHFLGRYPFHDRRLADELSRLGWPELEQNLESLSATDTERVVRLVGLHAWTVGWLGMVKTVETCWPQLSPGQCGAIFAGLLETTWTPETAAWIKRCLDDIAFAPESACQLACNSIRHGDMDILERVLSCEMDWQASIRRGDPGAYPDTDWPEMLDHLSHRLIDMIFQAAIFAGNLTAIKLALAKGANPDLFIWQLERSYNEKHSPLTYSISQSRIEVAKELLQAGASLKGNRHILPNLALHPAISNHETQLVDELLKHGASFHELPQTPQEEPKEEGSESEIINFSRKPFFGHFTKEVEWASRAVGAVIPLVDISSKVAFHDANAQSGQWSTYLNKLLYDDRFDELLKYEAAGMDTRLAAEELCTAVDWDSVKCLMYLLEKFGEAQRARALFRIRRHKPDFGAFRREVETFPQDDGINLAKDFNPEGKLGQTLPDGTRLYVDIDAIARPGHSHGPCLKGHFWLRGTEAVYRRRGQRVVITKLSNRWAMTSFPQNIHQVDDLLPCIKEVNGQFIHLGVTMGKLFYRVRDEAIKKFLYAWAETDEFKSVMNEAWRRMKEQDAANCRPPTPQLSDDELQGYPTIFWPYLIRLASGYIGMTPESCHENPSIMDSYENWSHQNKREESFVPDPRIQDWLEATQVPLEIRPFFHFDTLFDRPGIRHDPKNAYDEAMLSKATRWWNNWMTPQILAAIKEETPGKETDSH
jgi:hypothetical protein